MKKWDLYLVTEEKLSSGRSTVEIVRKAIAGGIDVVQLRDKNLDLRDRYNIGLLIKALAERNNIDFIVNDRVDLALALDADGVHLGQEDLPLREARKLMGSEKIIGISASNVDEAEIAAENGADYLGVGAIFATDSKKSKKGKREIGLELLKDISLSVEIPLVAIGGLNIDNIAQVIRAGADVIAVITAITEAENISDKVSILKKHIKNFRGGK